MTRNLKDIEKKISKAQEAIEKINKKEKKDGSLSNVDAGARSTYKKQLKRLEAEKESILNGGSETATPKKVDSTPTTTTTAAATTTAAPKTVTPAAPVVNKQPASTSSKEKLLENVEKKAAETADEMNDEEAKNKKIEDAKSAAETAKGIANQIDANVEENVPTWFWREAQEMAPSDKAKRGFIISNYILNRLGTAAGNIGAIVQNAGGSGGASLKEHGGSYIDQYRQSKLEQAMANRKTKQNNLLQMQIDAGIAIGVPENEARAIQNKLRNSKYWNKYNRLTNEQQVYIQGLLYSDTKGEITDAVLGNFIDKIMEGKDISLNNAAATALTAAGIDNIDELISGAGTIGEKVTNWLAGVAGWKKPGE